MSNFLSPRRSLTGRLPLASLLLSPLAAAAQAAASPEPAPAAPPQVQTIEVNGSRISDTDGRRRSTAAKIIVGREEIEKYGDNNLGDLLKRLPGVTMSGTPGRGGNIRMRGLGNGYTQILLNGERVQGGLSLDSLDPDQIERIEILRAPTAETGARAIGGTINIITRENFAQRRNDLRLSVGVDSGRLQPQASWSREDRFGAWDAGVMASVFRSDRDEDSSVRTVNPDEDRTELKSVQSQRDGVHLGGRVQWRGEGGESLMLMPMLMVSEGDSQRQTRFADGAVGTLPYQRSSSTVDSGMSLGRLNTQWRSPLGEGRLELKAGLGLSRNHSHTQRTDAEVDTGGDDVTDDRIHARERNASLNAKYALLADGGHDLAAGAEYEQSRRDETREQLLNGAPASTDFGDNVQARSRRLAAYVQDEWAVTPQWAVNGGLRWEGIRTEGDVSGGGTQDNLSSVWTPLLHAVYKPDPKGADQIRASLTRSYRSPKLGDLLGGTWLSKGENSLTNPDKAGNPDLKPELATGLDLAWEHYLSGGGLLSANLFVRRIQDLMRTVTTAVPQDDGSVRYVAQPQNIGAATTRGLELEAKFRLTEWIDTAPALDLRANAALYQSRVDEVPGPDNRLDQQAKGSLNLGADYRLPGLPVTVGGGVNWTPATRTRLAENQWAVEDAKRVVDAYAQWQLDPVTRLRLSAGNLGARVAESSSTVGDETAITRAQSYVSWRLQLEMKL